MITQTSLVIAPVKKESEIWLNLNNYQIMHTCVDYVIYHETCQKGLTVYSITMILIIQNDCESL